MLIIEVGEGIEMTSIFLILQRETEDESDVAYFFCQFVIPEVGFLLSFTFFEEVSFENIV